MKTKIDQNFFARNTLKVARDLLGVKLTHGPCAGIIVETEAYRDDEASHAITRPKTGRIMFDTYGFIYVYFIYGMYHCLNFTTEKDGVGAVLIRALEPTEGIDRMKRRRGLTDLQNLANGPGKLFKAMGLEPSLNGESIGNGMSVSNHRHFTEKEIATSPRIGISKATHLPWRFFVKDNPFISKKSHKAR